MDVKETVVTTLVEAFDAEYARLEDDNGISGFIVSPRFAGMRSLDRQRKIDEALGKASFTPAERRRVLMVAGVTPQEYQAVGARIAIHKVTEAADGSIEIVVLGVPSDAQYVRRSLQNQKGVRSTDPRKIAGHDALLSFRVTGNAAMPLTKAKVLRRPVIDSMRDRSEMLRLRQGRACGVHAPPQSPAVRACGIRTAPPWRLVLL